MLWILIRAMLSLSMVISGFTFAERFVIYAFDPRVVDPRSIGLAMVVQRIKSPDTGDVVIWRAPPKAGKPTLLYLHGNAGNLANRNQRFKIILSRGYGLIAPAYPGSSGSEGWPTQERLIETITQVYAGLTSGQITATPIRPIVYGESLGAAVALQVLANSKLIQPRAVVLEAPFSTLADVGRDLKGLARVFTPMLSSDWESVGAAPKLSAPLLIIHGTRDALIPIAQGRSVFAAAGSQDKEFYAVKGAGHTDLWTIKSQRHFFAWVDRRAEASNARIIPPDVVLRPRMPKRQRRR